MNIITQSVAFYKVFDILTTLPLDVDIVFMRQSLSKFLKLYIVVRKNWNKSTDKINSGNGIVGESTAGIMRRHLFGEIRE